MNSNSPPANMMKIFLKSTKNQDELKQQKLIFCKSFYAKTRKDDTKHNAYLFKLENKYYVVDCDDKNSYKFVKSLIKNHNLEVPYTKSISNIYGIDKYKHHFYFNNNLNKEHKLQINGSKLDLLCNSLIFEDSKQFENKIDLENLPDLTEEFYNDLILFNKIKDEIPQQPQGPKQNIESQEQEQEQEQEVNNNNKLDEKLKELINCFKLSRADNYDEWFKNGWAIYNFNKSLFNVFDYFSKKSNKYNSLEIVNIWKSYNKKGKCEKELNIGTLRYNAKLDNPDLYKIWCDKWENKTVEDYETIKSEFELTNFKIKNPIGFGYIDFEGNLTLINRSELLTLHENILFSTYNKKRMSMKLNHLLMHG